MSAPSGGSPYEGVTKFFLIVLILFIAAQALEMMGISVTNTMRRFGQAYSENQALWHGTLGLILVIVIAVYMMRKKD